MPIKVNRHDEQTAIVIMPETVMRDGVGEMKDVAQDLVDQGFKKAILDFQAVQRIDSQGLGQVVAFHITMQKAQVNCCVARMRESINELFSITNLDKVIDIYRSVPQALEEMS